MISVNSVEVFPDTVNIAIGQWYYDTFAYVLPEDATSKNVTWYSNNPNVASVNASNGYICGTGTGTVRIYAEATDGSGKRDYCTVTVSSDVWVTSITLNQTSLKLNPNGSYTLSATVLPDNANNKRLYWTSSNEAVAVVDDGVVSGLEVGTAVITALSTDGSAVRATCQVTVTEDNLVEAVTVVPKSKTMTVGDSVDLDAIVCPPNASQKSVTWSTDNPWVATVNSNSGLVMAQHAGTATIYALATDGSGKRGTCTVTVEEGIPVSWVTVSPTQKTMGEGETSTLVATVSPPEATNTSVVWYSDNSNVVSVNSETGQITAKKIGSTVIYAEARDGSEKRGSCIVSVIKTTTDSIEETPNSTAEGSKYADPVDVYSGAHLLNNTLMSLFGGQKLSFAVHYNSTKLVNGLLGIGWYHDFEKHLEVLDDEILVYNRPGVYTRYIGSEGGCIFNCSTPGKRGYVLTRDYCSTEYPYCVNCNSEKFEYYNSAGLLTKIVDHHGFEVVINYGDSLITITDMLTGKKIYLEKSCCDKITRVYDDAGRQAVLTYEGNFLVRVCDVNGNSLSYTYDAAGRILYGTDSKNIRYFENTYDEYGRVINQKDGIGSPSTLFEYGENGIRTITNRNGDTSTRVFNGNGLLEKWVDENGNQKTYAYDDNLNIIEEADGMCYSQKKVYNSFNKPTVVVDKNCNTKTLVYDSAGNVIKISYPENNCLIPEETFTYNSRNQVITHTDLRGTVTCYTYDSNGLPLTKKVGNKNPIQYVYENGLLMSETDTKGNITRYGYNGIGQRTSKTDAQNNTTSYEYDLCGNLLKTTYPNGKTVVNTYDCNYQKTSVTDANGNKTEYSYNGNMKNDTISLPDGNIIRYEYDSEDHLIKITDQAGNVTVKQYDKAGRVVSVQYPDGGVITYEYDKAGNVVKETDPKGAVTTKTYDGQGNVLTITDDNGNVVSCQYDSMSRLIREEGSAAGVILYSYSAAGDLLSKTDALGNEKRYTYDPFGNKLTDTDAMGNTTTYTYDANSNLKTTIL